MALLDLAHQSDVDCFVVHVNYHHRMTADRDQRLVQAYCDHHQIPCEVFDAPQEPGNFQDSARRFRYAKFMASAKEHGALGVLVAHHRDDDAETIKIQLDRKSLVTHYGLSDSVTLNGLRVDRPLLTFLKKELEDHCLQKKIDFGIDETNLEDTYLRNRIRKSLTSQDINKLLTQKEKLNQELDRFHADHKELLEANPLAIDRLESLEYPVLFLTHWLRRHLPVTALSEDYVIDLYRQIKTGRNFIQPFGEIRLYKQYGQIGSLKKSPSYTYSLKTPMNLSVPEFSIQVYSSHPEGFGVIDIDFPLTIRNARPDERFLIHGKTRSLARWFISHKIPLADRETWPVVENAQGEVIHIHRIRLERAYITPKNVMVMLK